MSFYFKVTYGDKSANIEMDGSKIFIGRSSTCQIQLKDPLVSNCHALITLLGDHLVVKDLQSTNGIIVNGKRVEEAKLYIGDEVRIGNTSLQLTSKAMTPEQTLIHTNKMKQIKTVVSEISLPKQKLPAKDSKRVKKNKKIKPVEVNLPDEDDD